MDSLLLSKIVMNLLPRQGSVAVPGLGIFSVEVMGASFSDKGFTINPPYRKIVFQSFQTEEQDAQSSIDGAFVKFYAKENEISVSRSNEIIARCVAGIRSELNLQKVSEIPGMGRLKMTRGGTVFFVENDGLQLFPEYDLLQSISLKSLREVETVTEAEVYAGQSAQPQPETVAEFEAAVEPTPAVEPAPAAEPEVEPVPAPARGNRALKVLLWSAASVIIVCALGLAALAVAGRTAPQLVDPYLYDAAQLEILHYQF